MDLIIPEGINRGNSPRVPKAPRGGPEVDPRRVIQDIFPSLTPDNDIVHQFKTSSAAGGMIISMIIPRGAIVGIIIPPC